MLVSVVVLTYRILVHIGTIIVVASPIVMDIVVDIVVIVVILVWVAIPFYLLPDHVEVVQSAYINIIAIITGSLIYV
jgi:hypothetical protein